MTIKTTTLNIIYYDIRRNKTIWSHSVIYTTFYGCGHYIVNDREKNDVTDNEFFTEQEAQQRIEILKQQGYISDEEYQKSPRSNTNTYELWSDADEYLDDLIAEEH